jgi:diacylglycerol kinase (ATP)
MSAYSIPTGRPAPSSPQAPARTPRLRAVSPHLLVVANANASGLVRRPELVEGAATLLRGLGARVETRLTSSLEELAETVAAAGRRVALLGGDGSLHAAANLPGPLPELALLPAGRANNVAHSIGVPLDLSAAAHLALAGHARPLDLIEARTATRRFLAVEGVSVGFHALARARYRSVNSADVVAGVKAGLGALASFGSITIGLEADGHFEVARIGQLFVANLPLFGPGLQVAPAADPADGLLDLVTIEAATRTELVSKLRRLRHGTHLALPGVRHLTAARIRIAPSGRSPVIADTTDLGSGTVELTVRPAALQLVGSAASPGRAGGRLQGFSRAEGNAA